MSLDSINLGQTKDLNYFFSDRSSIGENFDSTQFVTMIKQFYKARPVDSDIKGLLNEGYIINLRLLRKDSSVLQVKVDSKTLKYPEQEI